MASWEPIWTLDYSEQGEKMQRVVATRMFKPEGIQGYEWKMGTKQSWTAWFKASAGNRKTYNAESAVMTLELVDGG